jgi:quercetin dioxygenase-like cupin family protein
MSNEITYRNKLQGNKSTDPSTGSRFWSMEGKNVQFTWFDVPANKNFPNHKHDSEQVTYVLEGELFFRSENSVYKLSKVDCILIPGNTDHEVWTENIPAVAVDAWSPVNNLYTTNNKK